LYSDKPWIFDQSECSQGAIYIITDNKQLETNFSCKALVLIIIIGRPSQIRKEDAHLPPELRRAGLLAHMHIPKGKCFGPFNGKIMDRRKSPDKMHFFVSQVSV